MLHSEWFDSWMSKRFILLMEMIAGGDAQKSNIIDWINELDLVAYVKLLGPINKVLE